MNQLYTRRNIVISFTISFIILSFFVSYSFLNMKKAEYESNIVDKTLQSLRAMEDLMDDMQNIETGIRGYIISGDTQFLKPYYWAIEDLKQDTVSFKALYLLYPKRKNTFEELLLLVKRKADFSIASVNKYGKYSRDAASKQVQSGQGKKIMDSIRQIISTFENEDRQILQFSNRQREVAASVTAKIFAVLAIIFIIILIVLFLRLTRDLKNRDVNEKKISYLADIVEQSGDAIMSADTSFNIVSWNKGAEKMYGYSKEEAIGKKYHLLLDSNRSDTERDQIIGILKTSSYYATEHDYTRKDGYPIFVQASFTVLRDKNSTIKGCSIVHRDITEKKKTEKLLLEFNEKLNNQVQEKTFEINKVLERFNIVTRATNDVVWDADLKTGTVWWNDNFSEKFGYVLNDETTSPDFWNNHIHPDDKARVNAHIAYVLNQTTDTTWSNEYRFVKPDGCYINIYDRSSILRDEKGKAYRMIGTMADVTDLFIARKELTQSEEKYRTLVEQATDGIIVTDQNGVHLLVNTAACKLTQFSMEEMLALSIYDIVDKEDIKRQPFRFAELREGKTIITERILRKKDGQPVQVEINARLLSDGRLMAFIRDITEKRKAEEAVIKSNERFHIITKATSDIVWDWNLLDDSLRWNDNYYSKLGYEKQNEIVHIEEWYSRIHPDDVNRVKEKTKKVFAGNDSIWRDEYRYIKSDGIYLNFLDRGHIIRDKQGKALRMIGSMADITDLFLIQEELKKSKERYRSLIEQASDAILIYSYDGIIHSFNISASAQLGYTREEFLKLSLKDIIVGDIISDNVKYAAILAGDVVTIEKQLRKKDGSIIEVEVNAKSLSDGKVLAFARNITERKKAEINQQQQFDELQQLYNLSVLIDREKNIENIYEHATGSLLRGVKADRCSLLLFDSDGIIRFKASKEISMAFMKVAESYSPWHYTENQAPVFIEDIEKATAPEGLKDFILNEGIRSIGFIPLLFQGKLIGQFMICYNIPHSYKDNEIQFAKTVAQNIAFSIERNRSNEALQESENRYHSLVQQAADAITLFDKKGKILEVNDSALRLLGYKYGELMSMSLADIFTKEEISNNPIEYNLLEQGLSTINQRKMKRKDGSIVMTEVNSKILPDGRFLSMVRDLTDRIHAQKQIEKEKELSDNIIDSLPGVFYFYNETGKFIRWNKQLELVTGYTGKEISLMHPTQLFEGEDAKYIAERIAKVFLEGAGDAEAAFIHKDGSRKQYYFKAILVNFEGKPCLLGTGIDISDRKKTEKELNDSYKAIRKLTRHLQNVREEDRAHIAREIHDELGQYLTVLKMDISWVNKKIVNADELINQKMKDILLMLDETVKTVRRISSELRPSLLDDLGLIAAMEWQLHELKKRSDIEIIFTAPEKEIQFPEIIKTGLFRIFQESLTNVVRHSFAKKLTVSLEYKDTSFVLVITDDGKGFDKKKITDKRTLGILGMKERTSMIGGTYDITSIPDKGTIVVVEIPVKGYINNELASL